ncbi:MAG: sugar phosphate isomerase/epimerase family protein [Saprospiraceae bacterium]|nr:sugar phosphate isomerase/epimerase family protein [Saprospiraceae bacterium]
MSELKDYARLCVHTITTKPWSIESAIQEYALQGISGITVWRNALENKNIQHTGHLIREQGLEIVSFCRGGFFPSTELSKRKQAIDDNKRVIDEAAVLGAPLIVLVCGADPGQSLQDSRNQIRDGILEILPHAQSAGIKLAIEPLHPMYAGDRSAINTLKQANDMASEINSGYVGIALDVYHVWWDPDLENEIQRCGSMDKLFAFHICDWKLNTTDLLNDRGLMGEGCIPIRHIRSQVEEAGFNGFIEVEIFSTIYWSQDQKEYLSKIKQAYLHC